MRLHEKILAAVLVCCFAGCIPVMPPEKEATEDPVAAAYESAQAAESGATEVEAELWQDKPGPIAKAPPGGGMAIDEIGRQLAALDQRLASIEGRNEEAECQEPELLESEPEKTPEPPKAEEEATNRITIHVSEKLSHGWAEDWYQQQKQAFTDSGYVVGFEKHPDDELAAVYLEIEVDGVRLEAGKYVDPNEVQEFLSAHRESSREACRNPLCLCSDCSCEDCQSVGCTKKE